MTDDMMNLRSLVEETTDPRQLAGRSRTLTSPAYAGKRRGQASATPPDGTRSCTTDDGSGCNADQDSRHATSILSVHLGAAGLQSHTPTDKLHTNVMPELCIGILIQSRLPKRCDIRFGLVRIDFCWTSRTAA
jgi:hypothetical protein